MAEDSTGRVLHAVIREVEPGVFSAEYPGSVGHAEGGPEDFRDTHIATDPAAVRTWVETMAKSHGYDQVVWDDPS